jgi:hypothetical protein
MAKVRMAAAIVALLMALPSAGATGDEPVIVRPGAGIQISGAGTCTLGFLFVQRGLHDAPPTYWGLTAGHCVGDFGVHQAWARGAGPTVTLFDTAPIGEVRFAHLEPAAGLDVALVQLDDEYVTLNPQVCFWGGPTALHTTRQSGPADLVMFGHALEVEARPLRAVSMTGDIVEYIGPTYQGDSGGPVLTADGRALGLEHGVGPSIKGSQFSNGTAVRVDRQLQWIKQNLGLELDLMAAPSENRQWPQDLVGYREPGCYALSPVG